MMLTITPSSSRLGRTEFVAAGSSASVSQTVRKRVTIPGSSSNNTVQDSIITTDTGNTSAIEGNIIASAVLPDKVSYSSLDTGLATVDGSGVVTRVGTGLAGILTRIGRVTFRNDIPVGVEAGTNTTYLNSYVSGTLARNCADNVDTALAGKSAATALRIFTTQDHATGTYVRNTNLWCSAYVAKLTCCSPWNSSGGGNYAGTLVTPRHIIFAAHYQIPTGTTVRFVDASNNIVDRVMVAKKVHPSYVPYYPDLVIGVLSADVPASITPCKVLPSNFFTYAPCIANALANLPGIVDKIPAIALDQEEKALVNELYYDVNSANYRVPTDTKRLEFYENLVVGDSGNPSFLIINGDLVLVTVWTSGGAGAGTSINNNQLAAVNQMIVDADALAGISTGYTLTQVNLSGFTAF